MIETKTLLKSWAVNPDLCRKDQVCVDVEKDAAAVAAAE